eukprot:m.49905 g.49905  ORF g.49905 m.49905 type:complete len:373 (+) comp10638_c0_seq1:221-1339(+)
MAFVKFCQTNSATLFKVQSLTQITSHANVVCFRKYHNKPGIGDLLGASPNRTQPLPKSTKLFYRLGRSENGRIGPEVLVRSDGGTGDELQPFQYEPDIKRRFPMYGLVNTLNYDEMMDSKDEYVRARRNAASNIDEAKKRLRAPEKSRVLDVDPRCGNRRYDFVFTDVSKSKNDDTRLIFMREKDGTLRTADQDERDRINWKYFGKKGHVKWIQSVFSDMDELKIALGQFAHPYLLDELCKVRSEKDATYIKVHIEVYRDVEKRKCYSVLQDTPHFRGFVQWLVNNDKVEGFLQTLLEADRGNDVGEFLSVYVNERPSSDLAKKLSVALEKTTKKKLKNATDSDLLEVFQNQNSKKGKGARSKVTEKSKTRQ